MQLGKDFFEIYLQTFTVHLLKFNIYGLYYEIPYHFRMNIQNMDFLNIGNLTLFLKASFKMELTPFEKCKCHSWPRIKKDYPNLIQ